MPIKNEIIGIFKAVKINQSGTFTPFVVASTSSDITMATNAKNFVQGTPQNRVMEIAGITQTITIDAPILIGGAGGNDGRSLLNGQIINALLPTGATLPILKSGSIKIDETTANVTMTLLSDGNPENASIFEVEGLGSDLADILDPALNPIGPTRTAAFYDFQVNLAGFRYFVKNATITVDVETKPMYFIGGTPSFDVPGTPDGTPTGKQYPTFGVSGIKVGGSGTAAALLITTDTYPNDVSSDSVNTYITVTEQQPDLVKTSGDSFEFYIFDSTSDSGGVDTGDWVSIFTGFDLGYSVVSKAEFSVKPELLTVNFTFNCWVSPTTSN